MLQVLLQHLCGLMQGVAHRGLDNLPPAESPAWSVPPPIALNPAPLALTSLSDPLEGGQARCYTVRAQRGSVMSAATPISIAKA